MSHDILWRRHYRVARTLMAHNRARRDAEGVERLNITCTRHLFLASRFLPDGALCGAGSAGAFKLGDRAVTAGCRSCESS